jgi:DNA-binding IclR family transcriptional regulator
MSEGADEGVNKHTIPVIDRLMDVLGEIEKTDKGLTISDLTSVLKLPRTTIYRIVNSLQQHQMLYRDETGAYHLGRRLLALAAHVGVRATDYDLAAISQPFLDKLAGELGEGVKLSILDQEGVLVLAAAQGRREYALTVAPGQRMPIHAGAASKLLLAHLSEEDLAYQMSRPLKGFTPKTLTDPKRLRSELARIRRLGWAQDKGENAPSIQAYATPIFTQTGKMIAALSVPFLAGTAPGRMEEIRLAALETAKAISAAIPV